MSAGVPDDVRHFGVEMEGVFALNQKVGQNWGISWEGWGDAEMCILHFVNLVKGGMFAGRRPELAALNNH